MRQDHKPEGNTYGLPAGKIDENENKFSAMEREMFEETRIKLASSDLKYFKKIYVKYPAYHFVYHIFYTKLNYLPKIIISSLEHKEYKFFTPKEALKLNLIPDLDNCIKLFFKI